MKEKGDTCLANCGRGAFRVEVEFGFIGGFQFARPSGAWRRAWSWSQRRPWALLGVASILGTLLLGFAYGLWERVQWLQARIADPAAWTAIRDRVPMDEIGGILEWMMNQGMVGYALIVAAVFYLPWTR